MLTQISGVNKALESLALEVLDDHFRHCVACAIVSSDAGAAAEKSEELLEAVQRFAPTR